MPSIKESVFGLNSDKEKFISSLRSNVYCLPETEFYAFSNTVMSAKPPCHITGFILDNGMSGILINRDFYKSQLGEDFSDCIAYEVLFTSLTMWNFEKGNKHKQRNLDIVREAILSIRIDGQFERFLDFKEKQLVYYHQQGDQDCLGEIDQWYRDYSLYQNIDIKANPMGIIQ